ncbi:MAG: 30S ribosomal protein S3 [Tissierellia bacterium]|nr:30S ribosomal protein S3 [Bacillota bacterium]NLK58886.1 30S ribosomal protein S3 [Tissierellia bacterium]
MGQKVNPHGFRVGVIKNWDSRWFAGKKEFGDLLVEDHTIREYINSKAAQAGVSKIEIERASNRIKISIFTAKPGMIIGKGGQSVEELRKALEKRTGKTVLINVEEIRNQDMDAQLVAENIAGQLERRISFRRAMKQTIQRVMRSGAKGVKTMVSGRLGGADIARSESYSEGTIPLQTLRADIDYGFAEADTTYGKIGVKVWLCKGEILPTVDGQQPAQPRQRPQQKKDDRRRNDRRDQRSRDSRGRGGRGGQSRGRGQQPSGQR